MIRNTRQERGSDPALAAALADLREHELRQVDWDALRDTINHRAEFRLALRRKQAAIGVSRPLAVLVAAAGIAFAVWSGPRIFAEIVAPEAPIQASASLEGDALLEEAISGDLSEREFRLLLTGKANPEELIAFAIGRR